MAKLITFTCDHCNQPKELDELEQVVVYVHGDGDDPKVMEHDYVCGDCRYIFRQIVQNWAKGRELTFAA